MADIDFQNGFINGFVAGSTNIEVDMVSKRDTEANWQSINPIVANGEQVIVDTPDGVKIKIGDGVSHFNELEYTDKIIIDALDQKADKSELSNVNAAQLNGKTATDIENTSKAYADAAAKSVKDDLTNHSTEAYETLKQLGELIDDNKDALDALNTVATGKADLIHSHEIPDVNELPEKLEGIEKELKEKADSTEILPIVQDSIRAEAGPNIGTVGTPSVSSRIDGDDVVFTFDYLKGAKGNDGGKGDKGDPGVSATHSWDGTTLSVTSASGTSSADLKGEKGDPGTSATHSWDGTTLSITSASGTTSANLKGEKGDNGVGVSKIEQTTTSNVDGGENIITATLSNNQKSTFTIKNGSGGSAGARGSLWFSGTGITGTSTTEDIFTSSGVTSANVNDYFLNTSTGNVYKCTTGGNMQTAKWMYVGSVKGATGASISSATDLYYAKSNTTAPSAPTSAVTTNSSTTYNAWNKALPTYSASYPYYFTCVEILYGDGTRKWSTPVYVAALTSANQTANNAVTTANEAKTLAEGALPLSGGTMTGTIITPAGDDRGIEPATDGYGRIGSSTKKYDSAYAYSFYGSRFDGEYFTGCARGTTYGTCNTSASTAQKVAYLSFGSYGLSYTYYPETGARITIKFTYGNTASNPTLYVGNLYDIPIYYKGNPLTSTNSWEAGDIVDFICIDQPVNGVEKSTLEIIGITSNSGASASVVTASADGLVPKFDAADGTIDSSSTDWVLTNNNGSIGWYKLPTTAFSDSQYNFQGTYYGNDYEPHSLNLYNTSTKTYISEYGIVGKRIDKATSAEIFNDYKSNIATGICAHAEGSGTKASGNYAHAEGLRATASGSYTHAEGADSKASSYGAHAEGSGTIASGNNTHAEGYYTTASGAESHAEGVKTIAASKQQHVQGKFNIEDTANKYAHIVGNGEDGARSNCHTLDWNGVGWYSGGIRIGTDNMDDGISLGPVLEQVNIQTPVTQTMTKYAHTPNVNDAGTQNGNYENNYTNTQVVTIPGASSLTVTITYQTESLTYDWVCVFQGAHSDYTAQTSGYLKKLGGSTKQTETFTVTGDSVTFAFRSDTSQNAFYGYYAVVTGEQTTYVSTMKDKATGLWVKGDIYVGEDGPVKLGSGGGTTPTKITFSSYSNSTYKFSDGTTYQNVINLIEQGKEVILVYNVSSTQTRYYSYVKKQSDAYYFSCPAANGAYYDARLASTYFYSFETDMTEVQTYSSTSTSTHYLTGRTGTSNDQCDLYFSTLVYMTPSSGYLYAKSHATSSADYAEFYEWEDGNPNNEDRRGHFVTLSSGDKVRFATSEDDYILGVVSVSPAVLGNDYNAEWKGKYLTDVFGRVLTEEIYYEETMDAETGEIIPAHTEIIPILNPDYDDTQEYISREKRKEWVPVGTHGQLILIDNGLCEVGKYCMPGEDGTAVPSDQKDYRIIERLDDSHIKIVIK